MLSWVSIPLTWRSLGSWLPGRSWRSLGAQPWRARGALQALQSWETRVTCGETETQTELPSMLFEILFAEDARQGALGALGQQDLVSASKTSCLGSEEGLLLTASICCRWLAGENKGKEKGQHPEISVGYHSGEYAFYCVYGGGTLKKRNRNTELYFSDDVTSESLLPWYAREALLAT